jgi:hypothetical protein
MGLQGLTSGTEWVLLFRDYLTILHIKRLLMDAHLLYTDNQQ